MNARPLFAVAMVLGLLSVTGCSIDLGADVVNATGQFERRLTTNGRVDLDVTTGSGSVEIRRGDGPEVVVAGTVRANRGFWNGASAEERVRQVLSNPPVAQDGNSIRIGYFEDASLRRNISISYQILVPADTTVRSRSGSGSQRIDSLTGSVQVETGSGSIRVGRVTGSVVATTGSGSIEVMGANGLTARTGSGSIEATGVTGALRADTGSGGVRIEGTPTSDWNVRTGSGSIGLRLPPDAGFVVDATTASGSIRTTHPIEVQGSVSQRRLQGRVRGGGPRIDVSAGSGSIRLE